MDKTASTKKAYLHRVALLKAQCVRELRLDAIDRLDPGVLVDWLIGKSGEYARSTWRQYRAAVAFCLESASDPLTCSARDRLMSAPWTGRLKRTTRTSGNKAKKISVEDLVKISRFLRDLKAQTASLTGIWLWAGIYTGARPGEWFTARLHHPQGSGAVALEFDNAKATNGRANGKTRTLYLTGMSKDEIRHLESFIRVVQDRQDEAAFQRLYNKCRKMMYWAARCALGTRPQYPTLYTGRHQFIANAKRAGCSRREVAALVGHASDLTAGLHYGRRSAGNDALRVTPDPEAVATVRSPDRENQARRLSIG